MHLLTHKRVLNLHMANYSISCYVPPAGDSTGQFQDDLSNPKVGNWPQQQNIETITAVKVFAADVITGIDVTYKLKNSKDLVTVTHGDGGKVGKETLLIQLSATEIFLGFYIDVLKAASPYGAKSILKAIFVTADSSGETVTTKVYTTSGTYKGETVRTELNVGLGALTSFTSSPKGSTQPILQGVGLAVWLGPDN